MSVSRPSPPVHATRGANVGTGLRVHAGRLVLLFAFAAGLPPIAHAEDHPVVILTSSRIDAYQQAEAGVRDRLRKRRTLSYTLDGDPNLIPFVGRQLSLLKPSAIVAIGGLAAVTLKAHPVEAPVVFCLVVDHNHALDGLPQASAVSMHVPAEGAYDRISRLLPGHRIGIPYHPDRTGWLIRDLVAAFDGTSIDLVPFIVRSSHELGPALLSVRPAIDALWIVPDASFLDAVSIEYLLRYAVAERMPLVGYSAGFTRSGAIASFAGDYQDMGRQAAELVERIGRGEASPRIQAPRLVRTFVNLRVAERLGIVVNPGFAARAERVYP